MKIAILGADGLLGHELVEHFTARSEHVVMPLQLDDLDITDRDASKKVLLAIHPEVVINAAVLVSVEKCEADPEQAYAVNRDGVQNLLEASLILKTPPLFIQISSSEVFGRWNEGEYVVRGYQEDDEPKPMSVYQKSKAEAEAIITSFANEHPEVLRNWYIVRASWFFGAGRETFVEQFVRALQGRDELVVAEDQWRCPTWTRDFSEALDALMSKPEPNGMYHIANDVRPGEATVMDVIEEIRLFLDIPKSDVRMRRVKLHDFFKTPRAPSNVLLNTKLPKLRPWREALREYLTLRYPARTRS